MYLPSYFGDWVGRGRQWKYVAQAIDGYREIGDRHGEATALVNLAHFHHKNNDLTAAGSAADAAKVACEQHGFPQELTRIPLDLH